MFKIPLSSSYIYYRIKKPEALTKKCCKASPVNFYIKLSASNGIRITANEIIQPFLWSDQLTTTFKKITMRIYLPISIKTFNVNLVAAARMCIYNIAFPATSSRRPGKFSAEFDTRSCCPEMDTTINWERDERSAEYLTFNCISAERAATLQAFHECAVSAKKWFFE